MALQRSGRILLFVGFCAVLLISVAEGKRKARDLTPYCGGEQLSFELYVVYAKCRLCSSLNFLCVLIHSLQGSCG